MMSDQNESPDNLEEVNESPVEEPQVNEQVPAVEGHEPEIVGQEQEEEQVRKGPSASKAIRLATISKLLGRQTTEIGRIRQTVQPLQKQLKLLEARSGLITQMHSQLKQIQKQILQIQKDSQKIRISLASKKRSTTKRKK
jgi:hypothetical protein